jgi:hypothetical protein
MTTAATRAAARPPMTDVFSGASGPVAAIHKGASASVIINGWRRRLMVPGAARRLRAEVRDSMGQTVPGARVSWFSTDPGVARVDSASGWVRAVVLGRAALIATNGEWRDSTVIVVRPASPRPADSASASTASASSQPVSDSVADRASGNGGTRVPASRAEAAWTPNDSVAVAPDEVPTESLAGQGYEPDYEPAYREEEVATESTVPVFNHAESRRREAWLLAAVEQCYQALRSRDVARLEQWYRPATPSDQDKLNRLKRILTTEEWAAVVGERINGERHLAGDSPAMDFSFQLVWKDAFGGRLTSRPVFRTEIARSGSTWEISSCSIVGSPKL